MNLTQKQTQLLKIIRKANPDGTPVTLNELIERTDYKPSKDSMQFSIRALVKREMIEKCMIKKVGSSNHVRFKMLPLGLHLIADMIDTPFVTSIEDDHELSVLEAAISLS